MLIAMLALLQPALADPVWEPLPLVTEAQRKLGMVGGEGAQWPRSVQWAPDGSMFLLGIDVGGIYRYLPGKPFRPANVGYSPRGAAEIEFDPANPRRVLVVGSNSTTGEHHGLWLSTDGAASWRSVFPVRICGNDDMRDQIAFDPATALPDRSKTRVVYWSRVASDRPDMGNNPEIKPRLYKSEDGGETWRELPNSVTWGGAWLKHHPTRAGTLYAGTSEGLFVSTDGAATFTKTLSGEVTGLSVSTSAPDSLWVSGPQSLHVSTDSGRTWRALSTQGILRGTDRLRNLNVSPADSSRMVVWREAVPNDWNWPRFFSEDGGRTWSQSQMAQDGRNFLPLNARQGLFAWHPKRASEVWSLGGDWAVRSTDGGKTYRFASDGYNGILVGGRWSFSQSDPDLIFFGSQDYNGAVTRDAGRHWTYLNPAGNGWGGFCYGGYAVTRRFLIVGNAAGWNAPRILRISQDGGQTWTDTGITLSGADVSYGLPGRPNLAFAFDHRTVDGGRTWTKMNGCRGVFTHAGDRLYGADGGAVVMSRDQGATWTRLFDAGSDVQDLAVDPRSGRIYVVASERARVWDGTRLEDLPTPTDQFKLYRERTVAVDPVQPNVVYVGRAGNTYASDSAVLRSMDRGKTWTNLTRQRPLVGEELDGGREAICIRVHPRTREVFVATSCYGIWKTAGPK